MMQDQKSIRIADAIFRSWENGMVLSRDVLFFMESTFGITSFQELEALIRDNSNPDRDTLLELIFYPDLSVRLAIEPLLEGQGLSQAIVSEIETILAADHEQVRISYPPGKRPVLANSCGHHITSFVRRLYLDRDIDPGICDALSRHYPEPIALECRVSIRCTNINWSGLKKQLLGRFIQNASLHGEFVDLFEMVLGLLSDAPDRGPLEYHFMRRQQQEKDLLLDIQRFEEKRDRFSMEYLMMSRYPVPTDSIENVMKRVHLMGLINATLGIDMAVTHDQTFQRGKHARL